MKLPGALSISRKKGVLPAGNDAICPWEAMTKLRRGFADPLIRVRYSLCPLWMGLLGWDVYWVPTWYCLLGLSRPLHPLWRNYIFPHPNYFKHFNFTSKSDKYGMSRLASPTPPWLIDCRCPMRHCSCKSQGDPHKGWCWRGDNTSFQLQWKVLLPLPSSAWKEAIDFSDMQTNSLYHSVRHSLPCQRREVKRESIPSVGTVGHTILTITWWEQPRAAFCARLQANVVLEWPSG